MFIIHCYFGRDVVELGPRCDVLCLCEFEFLRRINKPALLTNE